MFVAPFRHFLTRRALPVARLALVALVCGLILAATAAPAGAAGPVAQVNPHGTYADFAFTSAAPAFFTMQVSKKPAVGLSIPEPIATKSSPSGSTYWQPRVEGLEPNTTYYYLALRQVGGNIATESGAFKTLKRKVTVNFWAIQVTDDSDSLGAGELHFNFKVNGNWQPNLAYGEVSVSSGGATYPDRTAVLLNAPATLKLSVQGVDDDCDISEPLCTAGVYSIHNTDGGSTDTADWATANSPYLTLKSGAGEAYSSLFTLTTTNHALKFVVSGSYSVVYVP